MTHTLPNGVEIPDEDLPIWEAYNFSCTIHPHRWGVCLHEEPPKSLNPSWKEEPDTRFVLCDECHQLAHSLNRADSAFMLNTARKDNFPDAEEKLWRLRK